MNRFDDCQIERHKSNHASVFRFPSRDKWFFIREIGFCLNNVFQLKYHNRNTTKLSYLYFMVELVVYQITFYFPVFKTYGISIKVCDF